MNNILIERCNSLIAESLNNDYKDNYDYDRFGEPAKEKHNKNTPIGKSY